MLNPGSDSSDFENLQGLLDRINENIGEIPDCPARILQQAKDSSSEAVEILQRLLKGQVENINESIESVSKAVSALPDLIEQIEQTSKESESKETETTEAEEKQDESQQTFIPEEDVALVLDFAGESNEHIASAEAGLLELETKADNKEVLNQIFRAFHTIKGMAGFLNLTDIGLLAHSAESLLDLARKGELALTGKSMDVVFEAVDTLKQMIQDIKDAVEQSDALRTPENFDRLLEKLKQACDSQNRQAENASGEKSVEKRSGLDRRNGTDRRQKNDPDYKGPERRKSEDRRSGTDRRSKASDKIKVSTEKLDSLINMAGELVIAQLMVTEEVNTKLKSEYDLNRKVVHQSKIVRDLQELSMSMRMVPITGVFQKMARLVRDLSHKADKKISFSTRGEETELDRSIVDKIADPLVHMVRNSVDHGIETPQNRTEAGKDPTGQIELRAFHQAGNIVIEIEDDGQGLDKSRILEKAIDKGLIETGEDLSDKEIYKLIFNAGFSTAQQVTTISGRGVGMDVVKKNIDSLRGKVDINSTPGKGTIFTIRLPLTMAIIDGQIVKVGGDRYIIPIHSIIHTLKPKAEQLSSIQNREQIVKVRGELLPLVRLHKLFGTEPTTEDPTKSLVVTVEEDGQKCCLLVDELLGQQQVVIKSLGGGLGEVKGVSGGAIMGDGKVSLILDIPGLIELAQN